MSEVTIFSQFFEPSLASTSQLMTDLAKGIAQRGYIVHVFTAIQAKKIPEAFTNLVVKRSFAPIQNSNNIFGKIISSLFFLIGALFFVLFQQSKVAPLLIASNPPYIGIIGVIFKFIRGGEYYFILQDIFPESAVLSGIIKSDSLAFWLFSQITYLTCKSAKKTIVLSTSMQSFLSQKYPDLSSRIVVIENWAIEDIPDLEKQENDFAKQHNLTDIFTVLYSGNIGRLHDIESIVTTAKLLADEPIRFVFIGDGPKTKYLEESIQAHQLTNILLLPLQPREKLSLTLTACDLSLVSLIEGAEQIVAPCKLYGILAAGRPIVAISAKDSYIDVMLSKYNCGVNCPPYQPEKLAVVLKQLANEPQTVKILGENAKNLYKQQYTFDRALDEYEQLLFSDRLQIHIASSNSISHQNDKLG